MYADRVSLSLRYLERKVSSGIVSNYTLCLVAYALALGKSSILERVITELTTRADYRGESECILRHKKCKITCKTVTDEILIKSVHTH